MADAQTGSMKARMMERINAKLPPPPEDWVDPEPSQTAEGEQNFTEMSREEWAAFLRSPAMTGSTP